LNTEIELDLEWSLRCVEGTPLRDQYQAELYP
jgi:hypothetical protein